MAHKVSAFSPVWEAANKRKWKYITSGTTWEATCCLSFARLPNQWQELHCLESFELKLRTAQFAWICDGIEMPASMGLTSNWGIPTTEWHLNNYSRTSRQLFRFISPNFSLSDSTTCCLFFPPQTSIDWSLLNEMHFTSVANLQLLTLAKLEPNWINGAWQLPLSNLTWSCFWKSCEQVNWFHPNWRGRKAVLVVVAI